MIEVKSFFFGFLLCGVFAASFQGKHIQSMREEAYQEGRQDTAPIWRTLSEKHKVAMFEELQQTGNEDLIEPLKSICGESHVVRASRECFVRLRTRGWRTGKDAPTTLSPTSCDSDPTLHEPWGRNLRHAV